MENIYQPAEDSYLLEEIIKRELSKNYSGKILEIGAGSGIIAECLIQKGIFSKKITLTDISRKVVNYLKEKFSNLEILHSNLFQNVEGKFDLIIFNPPYLPLDELEPKNSQVVTTGGKEGGELINSFLEQAKNYLTEKGKIFLLISNLTKEINFRDYEKKLLGKKKIFFEELFVYELKLPHLNN